MKRARDKREDLRHEDGVVAGFAASSEKAGPRRFTMTAYTGDAIKRPWGRIVIDLSGMDIPSKLPIVLNHDRDTIDGIVGYSDKSEVGKAGLVLDGAVSDHTPSGAMVKKLADEGYPWTASVGVIPFKIDTIAEGVTVAVNGRKFTGPLEVWRTSRLVETSFVTSGPADPGTNAQLLRDEETGTMKTFAEKLAEFEKAYPGRDKFHIAQLKLEREADSIDTVRAFNELLVEELKTKDSTLAAESKKRDDELALLRKERDERAAKDKTIQGLKDKTDHPGPGFAGRTAAETGAAGSSGTEDFSALPPLERAKRELENAPEELRDIAVEDLAAYYDAKRTGRARVSEATVKAAAAALTIDGDD